MPSADHRPWGGIRLQSASFSIALFMRWWGNSYSGGGNVGEISCDTGGVDNIVEGELVNQGAVLEQQGQWLLEWKYVNQFH